MSITISLADGIAFLNDSGKDWIPYTGESGQFKRYKIRAIDTDGKVTTGWIGERGTGETLGNNLVVNGINWTDSNSDGLADLWSPNSIQTSSIVTGNGFSGNAQRVDHIADWTGIAQLLNIENLPYLFKAGLSYRCNYLLSIGILFFPNSWTNFSINTGNAISTGPFYCTNLSGASDLIIALLPGNGDSYFEVDDIIVQQVLTPTTDGIKIYSTQYGSVQSWESIESGFNANSIANYELILVPAWLGTWQKRIQLTIDHTKVDDTQTDFPALIYLSAASGISDIDASCVFDELGSDANRLKIAVTADDGFTQLYVEIEQWDDAGEKAWLHVKVPDVSSSVDTILYLYYDSGQADNTDYVGDTNSSSAELVWESVNKIVYHFDQNPAGTVLDSTGNDNDGTSGGSMTSGDLIDGQVAKCLDMDGDDDCINLADDIETAGMLTVMALGKITGYTNRPGIGGNDTYYADGRIVIYTDQMIKFSTTTGDEHLIYLTETLPVDTFFLISVTRDSSNNLKVYLNATDITSESPTSDGSILWHRIGDNPDDSGLKSWYGPLDEFRLLNTCKSAAWVKATYNSLFDSLVTFGSEEVRTLISVPFFIMGLIGKLPLTMPVLVPVRGLSILRKVPSTESRVTIGTKTFCLVRYNPSSKSALSVPQKTIRFMKSNPYVMGSVPASLFLSGRVQTKYILTLTGWLDSMNDIEIPISSFSCRLSKVIKRSRMNIPPWFADANYFAGQIVNPTLLNGYQYRCIIPGRSASAGGGDSFPAWGIIRNFDTGKRIVPTVSKSNGHWYQAMNRGWTASAEPTWPTRSHVIVADGSLHWREGGLISQSSGEPAWPTTIGQQVNDNGILWENIGHFAVWQAETAYKSGEIVQPTTANFHQYRCTMAGTSDSAEPAWPTGNGAIIVDDGATWEEYGRVLHPVLMSLSTEIPDAASWLEAVNARLHGTFRLRREYQYPGGERIEGSYDVILQDINVKYTTNYSSISLTGTRTFTADYLSGSRIIELKNPQNQQSTRLGAWRFSRSGKIKHRCGVNTMLRPGDIVDINNELIEIDNILISVGSDKTYMDIESI